MVKVSAGDRRQKPKKPNPGFPLTSHNNGQWCKKIRGKVHFFGVWEDPQAALENYLRVAADLHAGRQPHDNTVSQDAVTVKDVCNVYLTSQMHKSEVKEITARWFEDCRRVVRHFAKFMDAGRCVSDLAPADFHAYRQKLLRGGMGRSGKGVGVHALNRAITVVRSMFSHAYQMDIIDKPIKFGDAFDKASKTQVRKSRNEQQQAHGKRMFTPSQVRDLIEAAPAPLKAMILLGINGGMGNTDCSALPMNAVDFSRSVIEFPRPKTGVERTVPIWDETRDALCEALAQRPKAKDDESRQLFFLTTFGRPWVRQKVYRKSEGPIEKVVYQDAVKQEFEKLLRRLGLKRRGIGFYTLRHTFRTWADQTKDQHAVHRIMGHVIPGMSGEYVEEITLDRLVEVTEFVRGKLPPQPQTDQAQPQPPAGGS